MTLFNDLRRKVAAATAVIRLADHHQEADEAALSFPLLATWIPFRLTRNRVRFSQETYH